MAPADRKAKAAFRSATDRLTRSVAPKIATIAQRFPSRNGRGLSPNHVFRWRRDDDPRNPQPGWERCIAALAREAAEAHRTQAADLDALAAELDPQPQGTRR